MSLFSNPQEHADNPPESWVVTKTSARVWRLRTKDGGILGSAPTKHEAESLRTEGFYVNLYEKERRWFAGEPVTGWRPYVPARP